MLGRDTAGDREAGSVREAWVARYRRVRELSRSHCRPLAIEDYVVQSMPDVSPPKWHLAHTTWFFETFLLEPFARGYERFDPRYAYLFNSYYETVGAMHPRPQRGLLSRPTVDQVLAYRDAIDEAMERLITTCGSDAWPEVARRLEIGLHHEHQHQELLLMDIKHILSCSPLEPAYHDAALPAGGEPSPLGWVDVEGGVVEIGHAGDGFAFDNERPRHRVLVERFALADRLVTCGEWLEFIADGGYDEPALWLSDGWSLACERGWRAPLYWIQKDGVWHEHTLSGTREVDPASPVVHVSYFEADAFARWSGARLPTEAEWEVAAAERSIEGNFADDGLFHPRPAEQGGRGLRQLFGDVWELTASPYVAYPGFQPLEGALGEYNGKFMCGQQVLRGGAAVTSRDHVRTTYRNFFYPSQRWPFQGLRLAR